MRINVGIEVKPWDVPNYIVVIPGNSAASGGIAIGDVDAQVLAQMCDTFRAEVFRKAGKSDPVVTKR
jgi:hypothetical protein